MPLHPASLRCLLLHPPLLRACQASRRVAARSPPPSTPGCPWARPPTSPSPPTSPRPSQPTPWLSGWTCTAAAAAARQAGGAVQHIWLRRKELPALPCRSRARQRLGRVGGRGWLRLCVGSQGQVSGPRGKRVGGVSRPQPHGIGDGGTRGRMALACGP